MRYGSMLGHGSVRIECQGLGASVITTLVRFVLPCLLGSLASAHPGIPDELTAQEYRVRSRRSRRQLGMSRCASAALWSTV